ncbi:hypothetical protein OG21DRAFT_1514998 [Imleria badia]|nr:hypothetical protein OG21DRAFT_1514998 [Imleria badia]
MYLRPDVHRWHVRQSYTSLSASSSSVPSSITIPIAIVSVVVVLILAMGIGRCLSKAQRSTHVAPRPVVQAPPGSRLGPVTAEILAGMQTRAQGSTYVAPRPVVHAPPGSRLGPVTAEILAGLHRQAGPVTRAPASSSAPAGDEDPAPAYANSTPRTVVIYRDAGGVEVTPVELPPPYASI